MADKKIIAVMGATGAQGGGLVRAILADPNGGFAARAITRDVNSDKVNPGAIHFEATQHEERQSAQRSRTQSQCFSVING